MLTAYAGTVVNQASMAAIQGINRPYMAIYSSSKAAVYSLSDCMRVELAPFDVKVSCPLPYPHLLGLPAELTLGAQVITLVTGSVKTEFFNNKEGGRTVSLPDSSLYSPIRKQVETLMAGSLSGPKGHDRYEVTRKTVAALLRYSSFRTRYIRRGWAAIKIWLIYLLLPTWLVDRWARQSGSLDKLKRIVHSTR